MIAINPLAASSNSPATSSSLDDSASPSPPLTNDTSGCSTNVDASATGNNTTTLTVSDDQSFTTPQQQLQQHLPTWQQRPLVTTTKLTTFGSDGPFKTTCTSSPKKLFPTNGTGKQSVNPAMVKLLPPSNATALYSACIQKEFADTFETKYLNKMCEDIEVSLNVDCECADDYSSNDFSGDYSFDNHNGNVSNSGGEYMMMKPYSMVPAKTNFTSVASKKVGLTAAGPGKMNNSNSSTSTVSNDGRDSTTSSSTSDKSQLGVLV
jgi:hypothetical protein